MSFGDGHFQRSVRHGKRYELLPVFGSRQAAGGFEPFVKRCGRQRGEQAKDRQPWRPGANLFQRAIGDAHSIVVHAKNERGNREDIALRQALEYGGILTGLVETFIHVFQIGRVDGFHADEDPLAAGGRD